MADDHTSQTTTTGPANVPGGVMSLSPGTVPGKPAVGSPLESSEPDTASVKLRAFEDKHLGKDATRINGEVERGVGSRFKGMSPQKHAEYVALEALVKAETDIADSSAALEKAKADHEAALKKLAVAHHASETAAAESH